MLYSIFPPHLCIYFYNIHPVLCLCTAWNHARLLDDRLPLLVSPSPPRGVGKVSQKSQQHVYFFLQGLNVFFRNRMFRNIPHAHDHTHDSWLECWQHSCFLIFNATLLPLQQSGTWALSPAGRAARMQHERTMSHAESQIRFAFLSQICISLSVSVSIYM